MRILAIVLGVLTVGSLVHAAEETCDIR